jgi:hypothetical protein
MQSFLFCVVLVAGLVILHAAGSALGLSFSRPVESCTGNTGAGCEIRQPVKTAQRKNAVLICLKGPEPE